MGVDIEGILRSLTLEEKVSLLAGKDFWQTVPIPAKGVPQIKCSDGPNGARGETFSGGTKAACFPAAVCSAATFNPELSRRIGRALAEESKSKGARVLLGPTMCNQRHPLGGRNFESFSEDPFLAGKMAAEVVKGLQELGVAATIKHYAANEQETCRLSVDTIVSERALREIYLKPFEICVKEADPWCVMTSYNLVNGVHADASPFLLQKVLRGEWGWNGLVMSDWGGTNHTAESLNAGLDLEMPGKTVHRKFPDVTKAMVSGSLSEKTIDDRARAVLKLIEQVGAFEDATIPAEQSIDKPQHRDLIRQVGGEGIVLLKNDNAILPITKDSIKGKKVALLGFAKEALIHGGGSASLNAHYRVSPMDALQAHFGSDVKFVFEKGAHTYRQFPAISKNVVDADGNPGWTVEFFKPGETSNPTRTIPKHGESSFTPIFDEGAKWKDCHIQGTLTPTETGEHYLSCSGLGPTKVTINDKVVFEQTGNCPDVMGFLLGGVKEEPFQVSMTAGQAYNVKIVSSPPKDGGFSLLGGASGTRLGFMTQQEHDTDLLLPAVSLASQCDLAIVFTGHPPIWETEGQDQVSFTLPRDGSQDALVKAVASANKNTIVVNSTGVAVAMPWIDVVPAVVQAWFPGQEAGNAIVDVLTGTVNPSGRLPLSWPKAIGNSPAFGNFPGTYDEAGKLTVKYEEGVFVGYRHYDRVAKDKVLFPFGYGLSYTTFKFDDGKVEAKADGNFTATVTASNTGSRSGSAVVQVYVGKKTPSEQNPIKTLAAFRKVFVEAGKPVTIDLPVLAKDFAFWDEAHGQWTVEEGEYVVSFGQSVVDIDSSAIFAIEKQLTFAP